MVGSTGREHGVYFFVELFPHPRVKKHVRLVFRTQCIRSTGVSEYTRYPYTHCVTSAVVNQLLGHDGYVLDFILEMLNDLEKNIIASVKLRLV
jgi:hypothetical protein